MTDAERDSLGLKCSSGYDAARSVFTYRKDVELLRGGLDDPLIGMG